MPGNRMVNILGPSGSPICEGEFVMEGSLALHQFACGLATSPFAIQLTCPFRLQHADGAGERPAEVKIPADAQAARAMKAQDRPGILEVRAVFDAVALGKGLSIEVRQFHSQGFYPWVTRGQGGRHFHAEGFPLAIFQPRIKFLRYHSDLQGS